jgi:DNA-binding protein H-NS
MRRAKKTSATDYDKMSLKELEAIERDVQKAIAAKRDLERAQLKKKMAELAESHGFSVNELFGAGRGVRGAAKNKSSGIPKYANPDNPADTWTGRGRKPNWLLDRLKKGASVEDFEI